MPWFSYEGRNKKSYLLCNLSGKYINIISLNDKTFAMIIYQYVLTKNHQEKALKDIS